MNVGNLMSFGLQKYARRKRVEKFGQKNIVLSIKSTLCVLRQQLSAAVIWLLFVAFAHPDEPRLNSNFGTYLGTCK
jgi:hypothetical protein